MKKFLIIHLLLMASFISKGDHNAGGEISWECIKSGSNSGKYIFQLKLYRYCTGIPLTAAASLFSNSPAGTISLSRISQTSIAPVSYAGCTGRVFDCQNPSSKEGSIEIHVYQSAPLTIGGIPPDTGWTFTWNACCRSAPIIYSKGVLTDNLEPQNQSFQVSSTMYPLPGQVSAQCFDSSPKFIESAPTVACTKYSNVILNSAIDADQDSLVYSFTTLKQSNGNPVTYATHLNTSQSIPRPIGGGFIVPSPGFSPERPLPWSHGNMNVLNQQAVLNSATGALSFLSFTPGQYAIGTRIDAYRNGVKSATILRDAAILLIHCDSLPYSLGPNSPPSIEFNSITQGVMFNHYSDTILIGETADFDIIVKDSQYVDTNVWQTITLKAFGSKLGQSFTKLITNCTSTDCAAIDTNLTSWNSTSKDFSDSIKIQTSLTWTPTCQDLKNGAGEYDLIKTFHFNFKAIDNFCGVPGQTYSTASITVIPDTTQTVRMDSIKVVGSNSATLYWKASTNPGFTNYYIYRSTQPTANFELLDSIPNISSNSFTDNGSFADSVYYYFIGLQNVIDPICAGSEVYGTTKLNLSQLFSNSNLLNWNEVKPYNSSNSSYEIYGLDSNKNEVLLATLNGSHSFLDSSLICLDTIIYYVKAFINGKYFTSSLPIPIEINKIYNQSLMLLQAISDTSGNVTLGWDTGSFNNNDFKKYYIFTADDTSGPFVLVDSISNFYNTSFIHLNAGADTSEKFYYIVVLGKSTCLNQDTLSQRSNILSTLGLNLYNMNNGFIHLTWKPFFNKKNKTLASPYYIYKRYPGYPWTLIDSTYYGQECYYDSILYCGVLMEYRVEMDSAGSLSSSWNAINVEEYFGLLKLDSGGILIGPEGNIHEWFLNGNPYPAPGNKSTFKPIENGKYSLIVTLSNGCKVITDTVNVLSVSINTLSNPNRNVEVLPNPNNGQFLINLPLQAGEEASIQINDYLGKIIYSGSVSANEGSNTYRKDIDLRVFPKGVYLMNILISNEVVVKKIVLF